LIFEPSRKRPHFPSAFSFSRASQIPPVKTFHFLKLRELIFQPPKNKKQFATWGKYSKCFLQFPPTANMRLTFNGINAQSFTQIEIIYPDVGRPKVRAKFSKTADIARMFCQVCRLQKNIKFPVEIFLP
jgi:hypothetical protein